MTENAPAVAAQAAANGRGARALTVIRRRTGFTKAGLVLLVAGVLAWVVGRYVGGRPLYVMSYASIAVLGGSWFYGRRPLPLTGVRSEPRARLAEGETIRIDVTLNAERRTSTFILEEIVPLELGVTAQVPVPSVEPGETVGHGYELTLPRRGSYTIGPLVARWGDPFGLTERELALVEPFEVLVHPRVEPISDRPFTRLWEDPEHRPPISKPWSTGQEFYGMRNYARGDDVRRVVWRAFARTGQLLVRESEQGITDKVVVLLDTDTEYHSAGEVSDSFEAGVRVAASMGVHHLRESMQVICEVNAGRIAGPLRSGPARLQLLDELARVERDKTPLVTGLDRFTRTGPRDAHYVIVTPFLTQEAIARIRLLIDRGPSVMVVALIWDELAVLSLSGAAAMDAQVMEVRPHTPFSVAARHIVGTGR